jgi:hypothetical protein
MSYGVKRKEEEKEQKGKKNVDGNDPSTNDLEQTK